MGDPQPSFNDTSEDCAICLSPLSPSTSCLTLTCGHIYHKACILQQLAHSKPDPSHRLIFTGCLCSKCKQFCDHPELQNVTSHTKELLAKVDAIIHGLEGTTDVDIPELRRKYAFYLCSVCNNPFFGGTVQCVNHSSRHEIPPNERICEPCSLSVINTTCTDASHSPYHVWKCRLCCNPSERVCFGRTHFCDNCHTKFSADETVSPVPCAGRPACTQPLPPSAELHANGAGVECEQLLFCGLCRSAPGGIPEDTTRYSRNLLQNPSGEDGNRGWVQFSYMRWQTEISEVPFPPYDHNFVSSYQMCAQAQVVDLARFVRNPSAEDLTVCVSARYRARTDCPSTFIMKTSLLDDDLNEVVYRKTDDLQAPADCWEIVRVNMPVRDTNARFVAIAIKGKDNLFWRGLYGSKVTDCRVSIVLGDQDEGEVMKDVPVTGMDDACLRAAEAFRQHRVREGMEAQRRLRQGFIRVTMEQHGRYAHNGQRGERLQRREDMRQLREELSQLREEMGRLREEQRQLQEENRGLGEQLRQLREEQQGRRE